MRSKFKIGVGCLCGGAVMWAVVRLYQELVDAYEQSGSLTNLEYSWFFQLLLNLAGYAMIMVPGFVLYKYLEKTNYFDNVGSKSPLSRALLTCFGPPELLPADRPAGAEPEPRRDAFELMFCFTGLMAAYLVWGLLQEKIMTQSYTLRDGSAARLADAQLLVLANRLAALAAAALRLRAARRAAPRPLARFSYCALTNVLSAWCQYEALKYVSFPAQVLSKSCKVLPVMLMGKIVSRNKYETYEYVTAVLISLGMILFMLGSGTTDWESAHTWAISSAGLILLVIYLSCDAFTSSWQHKLFVTTKCEPLQMLCAVNMFSCAFSAPALLRLRDPPRLALLQHAGFLRDATLLSLSSALGQLLIYRTIARFGAVVFALIMTLRQAVSILLSCLVYGHSISASGAAGVALVFVAVLLRLYCAQRIRKRLARNRLDT